jgi:hypothetical protein
MNTPGFTAEAAMCSRAVPVHSHASDRNRPSAGNVTMAWRFNPNCGPCPPDQRACPNPDGYGCNLCVLRNEPCPGPN